MLLNRVSLELNAGELICLVGPNAAGKSTLLRVLSGELGADSGTAACLGCPIGGWSLPALARTRAVLPQSDLLNFPFTVSEVVALGRQPHIGRESRSEGARVVREVMKAVGIDGLSGRTYTHLSGGERRRVQLGRVLAQIWSGSGPRFLLLDEHTAGLDLAHQHSSFLLLRRLLEREIGVLAVVHDLDLAVRYADRLGIMERGHLCRCMTPSEALADDLASRVFGVIIRMTECGDGVRVEPTAGQGQP